MFGHSQQLPPLLVQYTAHSGSIPFIPYRVLVDGYPFSPFPPYVDTCPQYDDAPFYMSPNMDTPFYMPPSMNALPYFAPHPVDIPMCSKSGSCVTFSCALHHPEHRRKLCHSGAMCKCITCPNLHPGNRLLGKQMLVKFRMTDPDGEVKISEAKRTYASVMVLELYEAARYKLNLPNESRARMELSLDDVFLGDRTRYIFETKVRDLCIIDVHFKRAPTTCRYGKGCKRADCLYSHPEGKQPVCSDQTCRGGCGRQHKGDLKMRCKAGAYCNNPECRLHPH